jgi:hypothetical protein
MNKLHYKGWDILPTVLPTANHKWSASCDLIEHRGAGDTEVFEGATMQFIRDTEDEALAAACNEAYIQIDNILADPSVRLA